MSRFLDNVNTIESQNQACRTVVHEDGIADLGQYLAEQKLTSGRSFIITDSNVERLYGSMILGVLEAAEVDATILTMPAGEENKNLRQVGEFIETLSEQNATRNDTIIAFGGGVVGDLGGFVASIYNRGLPLVQVPTTLLAMVDASVGGKTGVDHGGKNKTGSFYQPKLVIADPAVLRTLDQRTYLEGFGEIVKYAMLDADFLPELEASAKTVKSPEDMKELGSVIARCVVQKSNVIASDPFENAPQGRVLLNYGHTLGHALEAAGQYTELLHGEAVAIGMTYAMRLAIETGIATQDLAARQESLLHAFELPTSYHGTATLHEIMPHIAKDKKNTAASTTRFVLPKAAGRMAVMQINNARVESSVESFLQS